MDTRCFKIFSSETPKETTQNTKEDLRNAIKYKVELITKLEQEVARGLEAAEQLKCMDSGLKRNMLEYLFEGEK